MNFGKVEPVSNLNSNHTQMLDLFVFGVNGLKFAHIAQFLRNLYNGLPFLVCSVNKIFWSERQRNEVNFM